VASIVVIVLHGKSMCFGFCNASKPNNSRYKLTAHGVQPVALLDVLSHFRQKAVGNPAPPPILAHFNGRVEKNQSDDDVPHGQTLVG